MTNFASLLITIAFGYAMITYYSQPISGLGISFYHLIVDQGLDLANQLNHSLVHEIWDGLNSLYFGMEMPAISIHLNVTEVIRYTVVVVALLAAEAAIFVPFNGQKQPALRRDHTPTILFSPSKAGLTAETPPTWP